MTNWIISANAKMYDHTSSFEHYSYIDWRQSANFEINDIVFIYCTSPTKMIQYKCVVEQINLTYPNIRDDKEYWKDLNEYEKSLSGKFARLKLVEQIYNENLSLDKLLLNGLNSAPQRPIKASENLVRYIDSHFSDSFQPDFFPEMISAESTEFEGVKKQILVNKYERSSIARQKCIDFHGLDCKVCDINFEKLYGEIGKHFIHIHHIVPISKIGKAYKVDYEKDLIPVCPNCHSMLHRKINNAEPTIDELKTMIKKNSR